MSFYPHYPVDGIQSQDFWRLWQHPPVAFYNLDINLRLVILYVKMVGRDCSI